jgi:light-regulated signal transduction histidine kinase (bacteriophytochrome)
MAFGQLWGLIACHAYGHHGMRVSFPVRQMMRLLSDSISKNIERLSYAQRLHTRKLVSPLTSPTLRVLILDFNYPIPTSPYRLHCLERR